MSTASVLIDAGNTRLKWVRVEGGRWAAQGGSDYRDWTAFERALDGAPDCFVASVAGAAQAQALAGRLAAASARVTWLTAAPAFGEVVNGYASPQQLGVDRWMGLIAARARSREAVLVVSAGTALTADALAADGRFLGGVIVPGLALMRQALQTGTAGVAPLGGNVEAFPRATSDAVASGLVAALCGAVRQQYDYLAAQAGVAPRCLLSGGDAERIRPHLGLPAEIVPTLVLEGIERVAAKENTE
ncbi:MAG: type III pantothenate kinase [Gammaproteobacteria bacterium]